MLSVKLRQFGLGLNVLMYMEIKVNLSHKQYHPKACHMSQLSCKFGESACNPYWVIILQHPLVCSWILRVFWFYDEYQTVLIFDNYFPKIQFIFLFCFVIQRALTCLKMILTGIKVLWEYVISATHPLFTASVLNLYWVIMLTSSSGTNHVLQKHGYEGQLVL